MSNTAGFDVKRPSLDRACAPHKGLPVRFYTYRGGKPWTPTKSR